MRWIIGLVLPVVVISIMTAIALGLVISASNGRTNLPLLAAFVLNSASLLVIACALGVRRVNQPGTRSHRPRRASSRRSSSRTSRQ